MRNLFSTAAALLLASCAATPMETARTPLSLPAPVAPSFTSAPLDTSIPSDLPRIARPLHYAITVEPDAAALTLRGTAAIDLELYEPSDHLILHAKDLTISLAAIVLDDGTRVPLVVSEDDPAKQTFRFTADRILTPGTYRLEAAYTGIINTQAVGLFALDYPDKITGEEERGLFTQFQAPDGRRFAPMFDEPAYKATFDLAAVIPEDQMAVGNMPVLEEVAAGYGTKFVRFATSPKMSSYLLFLAVGDFERASMIAPDGTDIGIVAPIGSGEQTQYALESMAPLLPWFEDYFGLAYPLPKLDNVTAPGRSQFFGAMENWGAMLTFERILLYDPANTSPRTKQLIYAVQVHEVAHQWFGNIVTMAWWDDLWLNEGFASWLETKVTHEFNPTWHADLGRIAVRERAMELDAVASTHPVIQEITTVAETAQAFDQITYAKGEAVIAMFEAFAGEEVWRDGLRAYIAEHAYANTTSADLWAAMEAAGATGLRGVADDFTRQAGVPLVSATSECVGGNTQLTLAQSEFTRDRRDDPTGSAQSWRVPLNIAVNGQAPVPHLLQGSAALSLPGCGAVIVNSGQLGYFRSSYADDMVAQQVAAFYSLTPADQLGMLRDALVLSDAGYKPVGYAFDLLEAVPGDANPLVAQAAAEAWAGAYDALAEELADERAAIASMGNAAWSPRLVQLGFEPIVDEPLVDANLRSALIGALGRMGDATIAAEAQRRFAMLANNPRALDGPLKSRWLGIAAQNAGPQEWELLAQLAAGSNSTVERELYYTSLAATQDAALAQRALDLALTAEAGTVSAGIIAEVANLHPDLAFNFALENLVAVRALVDASGWQDYLGDLTGTSYDLATLARLEQLQTELPADEAVPIARAASNLRLRIATREAGQAALLAWLAERGD